MHDRIDDRHLVERGLTNYWGYNTLGFFAPDARYSPPPAARTAVREFKTMVRALHAAGFEVILDVVYNHTGEGKHEGLTVAFGASTIASLLPACTRRIRALPGLHGHAATRSISIIRESSNS